jgi:glutamyl-Q tRNA(Asp) synthetase
MTQLQSNEASSSNSSYHPEPAGYIGRFAPSPTGFLHIGSLIGALASYLDANASKGQWLVRIEDLDPPRETPGAAIAILESLKAHGLHWHGEVLWQSKQHQRYQQIVEQLLNDGKAFYCSCSRNKLQAQEGIHQNSCKADLDQPCAVRLIVCDGTIGFEDPIQGLFTQQLRRDVGDFVIQRKDKLFAYQLAVVLDDALQGVTHVVRGSDLLDSTLRQQFLQHQLNLPQPHYLHIPVITNQEGQKLSKQTFAPALENDKACDNLLQALFFLNQPVPPLDHQNNCESILQWAITHWDSKQIDHQIKIDESKLQHFASSQQLQ